MVGQIVSHYKILEKVGEGGMGVVYKAQDTTLDRFVALKFLPSELTASEEERARFVREARSVSALDHPNICTVFEADFTPGGQMFIAMAYYEGSSLNRIIEKGRLSIQEALRIAIQVTEGLAAAHERRIVHRDVKPGNIIVTSSGQVKLMDFGLATQQGRTKLTRTHATIGTAAYMSPEQATGEAVDDRTDLWSLGVVLYEMLTGSLPFRGEHEAAIMYSIVNEEPAPIEQRVKDASPELLHIVRRALEKNPAERYQSASDLLIDLRRLKKDTSRTAYPSVTVPRTVRREGRRKRMFILSAAFSMIVVLTVSLIFFPSRQMKLNPNRIITVLPLPTGTINYSRLSHDGNWIAFAGANESNVWDIYYMNAFGGSIRNITNGEIPTGPSIPGVSDISRDGARILFYRPHARDIFEVAQMPSLGGSAKPLASGTMPRYIDADKRILYFKSRPGVQYGDEIWVTNTDGSDSRLVHRDTLTVANNAPVSFYPSPDGTRVAYIKTFPDYSQDLFTISIDDGDERRVTFTRTTKDEVFWTHDDYLIYSSFANNNYDLWACPVEGGEPLQLTISSANEVQAQLSDDGRKLLYFERSQRGDIKSLDLGTGVLSVITNDDTPRRSLIVSPDGRYFAYSQYTVPPALANSIEVFDRTLEHPTWTIVEGIGIGERAWSSDGQLIAYFSKPDTIGGDLRLSIVPLFGTSSPKVLATGNRMTGLRWIDKKTITWFENMKTWASSIDDLKKYQIFEDSTLASPIQNGKYMLFRDFRTGRQGIWVVRLAQGGGNSARESRKVLESGPFWVSPDHRFLLTLGPERRLRKIHLPSGHVETLNGKLPRGRDLNVSADGRTLYFVEIVSRSKLVHWENPFVWD